jgi:hypothetical protein
MIIVGFCFEFFNGGGLLKDSNCHCTLSDSLLASWVFGSGFVSVGVVISFHGLGRLGFFYKTWG